MEEGVFVAEVVMRGVRSEHDHECEIAESYQSSFMIVHDRSW